MIVGGILTYLSTIKIEKDKRQYELRKEVYFDLMSAIIDFRREYEEYELDRTNIVESKSLIFSTMSHPQIERLKRASALLKLLQMKMEICASKDTNRICRDAILKAQNVEDYQAFNDTVFNQLIPAMEEDLTKNQQHWWQFWK